MTVFSALSSRFAVVLYENTTAAFDKVRACPSPGHERAEPQGIACRTGGPEEATRGMLTAGHSVRRVCHDDNVIVLYPFVQLPGLETGITGGCGRSRLSLAWKPL